MQVYINAKSKASVNRDLKEGKTVFAKEIKLGGVIDYTFDQLPNGTTVKIYEKCIGGNPYAKAYGFVKNGKLS
jgi:hypothetical protein